MKLKQIAVLIAAFALVGLSTACIIRTQAGVQRSASARSAGDRWPRGWKTDASGRFVPATPQEMQAAARAFRPAPLLTMPTMPNGRPAAGFTAVSGETYATDDEGHDWVRGTNGWIPVYR